MMNKDVLTELSELLNYEDDDDYDEKAYALAVLNLLEPFYLKYYDKDIKYLSAHFDDDFDKLCYKLDKVNDKYFDKYVKSQLKSIREEFKEDYISKSLNKFKPSYVEVKSILKDTFKRNAQYLKDSISIMIRSSEGTVNSNLNNAKSDITKYIKSNKRAIKFTTHRVKSKIRRDIELKVYGDDALAEWFCLGNNPCNWCLDLQSEGAKPLSEMPLDHVNGHCVVRIKTD